MRCDFIYSTYLTCGGDHFLQTSFLTWCSLTPLPFPVPATAAFLFPPLAPFSSSSCPCPCDADAGVGVTGGCSDSHHGQQGGMQGGRQASCWLLSIQNPRNSVAVRKKAAMHIEGRSTERVHACLACSCLTRAQAARCCCSTRSMLNEHY